MQFEKGYLSPYMVTNSERMEAILENAYILITDMVINNMTDILPILEKTLKLSKPLLIIADKLESEPLNTLVLNKLRGTLNVVVVKAPSFGNKRFNLLEDIAILTGGEVISKEKGLSLADVDIEQLGEANKIIVTKDFTSIIDGHNNPKLLENRVTHIKNQISLEKLDYDKEILIERLSKLCGGVAVIKVGATTETEMKEKNFE